MTSRAFFSLMPAGSSSRAVAVARDSIVWKPISWSFLLVAGPTPGKSSKYSYFGLVEVVDSVSGSSSCSATVILRDYPKRVCTHGTSRQFEC